MRIVDTEIGTGYPPYFIAEVGANHDGDLDRALRLIELAADAGADAVKFQHFEVETLVSRRGFAELGGKLAHQAAWGKDVYEVYEDASLPRDWTEHLSAYAHDHGMAFITTPYSLELADLVEPYVDAYKIGSGDVTYHELIEHVAGKGKPVLIATGASTAREVNEAIDAVWRGNPNADLCLMQCTTDYSGEVPWESLNLSVLSHWTDYHGYHYVGFSDHTPGHAAVLAAIALGARVIEKHFTDYKGRRGPDHSFALEPVEWCNMIDDAKRVYAALGDGVKKVEANEEEARVVQRRALRWKRDLYEGQTVEPEMIVATRPCPKGAMDPRVDVTIIGRQLKRDVEADDLVRIEDVA